MTLIIENIPETFFHCDTKQKDSLSSLFIDKEQKRS